MAGQVTSGPSDAVLWWQTGDDQLWFLQSTGLGLVQGWGHPGPSLTLLQGTGQHGGVSNLNFQSLQVQRPWVERISRGLRARSLCLWVTSAFAQGTNPFFFRWNKALYSHHPSTCRRQSTRPGLLLVQLTGSWCHQPREQERGKSQASTPQQLGRVWIQGDLFLISAEENEDACQFLKGAWWTFGSSGRKWQKRVLQGRAGLCSHSSFGFPLGWGRAPQITPQALQGAEQGEGTERSTPSHGWRGDKFSFHTFFNRTEICTKSDSFLASLGWFFPPHRFIPHQGKDSWEEGTGWPGQREPQDSSGSDWEPRGISLCVSPGEGWGTSLSSPSFFA